MKKVLSEITYLPIEDEITSENIETTLENCFGSVLRWAIVDINNNGIKVSFTYEKDI